MTGDQPAADKAAALTWASAHTEAPAPTEVSWPEALDRLQTDVEEAEQLLASERADEIAAWGSPVTAWVHPSSLGPVPEQLRERAARLLQHQLAVAERLVERMTQSQRQRDVAARMSYGPSRPVAAYIDQAM